MIIRLNISPVNKDKLYYKLTKGSPGAAAYDIKTTGLIDIIGDVYVYGTNLSMELQHGTYAQLLTRSSMAMRNVIVVGGVIDSDYRGEIKVMLQSKMDPNVNIGDKIAQLVILPVPIVDISYVDNLTTTQRGIYGFGSTGR